MKNLKCCCTVILMALLAGCSAPPQQIALAPTARTQIKSASCVIIKTQNELNANIEKSFLKENPMTLGLLGVMIGNGIEGDREIEANKTISPIRSVLADYNVESKLSGNLHPILKKVVWLNAKQVNIKEAFDFKTEQAILKLNDHNTDVLVVIKPSYALTPAFKDLVMTIDLDIYPHSEQMKASLPNDQKDKNWPIYRTKVKHTWTLNNEAVSESDAEKNATLWVENHGEQIKAALNETTGILLKKIEEQLNDPEAVVKIT